MDNYIGKCFNWLKEKLLHILYCYTYSVKNMKKVTQSYAQGMNCKSLSLARISSSSSSVHECVCVHMCACMLVHACNIYRPKNKKKWVEASKIIWNMDLLTHSFKFMSSPRQWACADVMGINFLQRLKHKSLTCYRSTLETRIQNSFNMLT